jgi:hypothetical protein
MRRGSRELFLLLTTGLHCYDFGCVAATSAEAQDAIFQQFDTDGSGSLSRLEFERMIVYFEPTITRPNVDALWQVVDTDRNGQVSVAEYNAARVAVLGSRVGSALDQGYTNMTTQFGAGPCADSSGEAYSSWNGPFITFGSCRSYCDAFPSCQGFSYGVTFGICEIQFGKGDLPEANPGSFWQRWDQGQAVGVITQVIHDGGQRQCYRKDAIITTDSTSSTATVSDTSTATSFATSTATSTHMSSTSTATSTHMSSTVPSTTTVSSTTTASSTQDLLTNVKEAEHNIVDSMIVGNETNVQTSVAGVTIVATRIVKDDIVNGSQSAVVTAENTSASVTVPLVLLDQFGEDVIVVFSIFSEEALASQGGDGPQFETGGGEDALQVRTGVDINIALGSTGVFQNVSNLDVPIVIKIPTASFRRRLQVSSDNDLRCAFWDEVALRWAADGLTTLASDGSDALVCATTHLTFFAAIRSGFVNSVKCTPLRSLFEKESYEMIWKGTWWQETPAVLFFVVLFLLLTVFLYAIAVDIRRMRPKTAGELAWRDEFFLIPTGSPDLCAEEEKLTCCQRVRYLFVEIRSALDDVAEKMGQLWFRGVRSFCETFYEQQQQHQQQEEPKAQDRLSFRMLASLLHMNARRQACVSLKMTPENAKFFLERLDDLEKGAETGHGHMCHVNSQTSHRHNLGKLSHKVKKHMNEQYTEHKSWRKCCKMAWRDFRSFMPLAQIYLRSIFVNSSMRALIFINHVLGACTCCTAFLSVSTFKHGKSTRPDEDCEQQGFWELFGRMLLITIAAAFLGAVPAAVLQSLHRRRFKSVSYVGCPEWKRQLRAWRCQDAIFWVFGLAWVGGCIFVNILFIANVSSDDLDDWFADLSMEFIEIVLLIPLAVAVATLLVIMMFLGCVAWRHGVCKEDMVKRIQEKPKVTRPLKVTVVGCKGLQNADWIGLSDPYCICEILGEEDWKFRTKVITGTLDPVWNHVETLTEYVVGDALVFKVYDRDVGNADDFLGEVVLKASSLENGFDGELPLLNAGRGVSPTIHIRAAFEEAQQPSEAGEQAQQPSEAGEQVPTVGSEDLPCDTVRSSNMTSELSSCWQAPWSAEEAFVLCRDGEEAPYLDQLLFLSRRGQDASLIGTWTYAGGQSYTISVHGDNLHFVDHHSDGGVAVGELAEAGDGYFYGELIKGGSLLGTIRIRRQGEEAVSNFKKNGRSGWGADIVATKEAHGVKEMVVALNAFRYGHLEANWCAFFCKTTGCYHVLCRAGATREALRKLELPQEASPRELELEEEEKGPPDAKKTDLLLRDVELGFLDEPL